MADNERILENLKTTLCDMVEIIDFETKRDKQDVKELDNDVSKIIDLLDELEEYRAIGTVEEVRMLKDYKELYDVYNLIGTIEEFRNLKYKKNVLPIATITINKEDMQKMVDEKVAQIELDIQEIRAKAIDEFAEALRLKCLDSVYCEVGMYSILKIAEQMKAGGKE